jgi:hypothetical protein
MKKKPSGHCPFNMYLSGEATSTKKVAYFKGTIMYFDDFKKKSPNLRSLPDVSVRSIKLYFWRILQRRLTQVADLKQKI